MAKFKKIIPALCMLVVSAIMAVSTTYAWFSMNTQVSATGMQVTAKSNETFLLISSTKTAAGDIQTENAITTALTVDADAAKVYPSAPALNDTEVGYLTTTGKTVGGVSITTEGKKVTDANTAAAYTNWYTAYATKASEATIKDGSAVQLTAFTGYVIEKTVYLTVAKGSNPANNLTVTPTFTVKTGGEDLTAAKIVITTDDGGFAVLSYENNGTKVDIKGTNTSLTDSTVRTVKIYIYYDGNDSNVYTNNIADLKGVDIFLVFDVAAVPAA